MYQKTLINATKARNFQSRRSVSQCLNLRKEVYPLDLVFQKHCKRELRLQ